MTTAGRLIHYLCEDMDAGLPMHAHEPGAGYEHDVTCTAGRVVVFIHPGEVHELGPGERLVFDSKAWHGIYPLEPRSAFTNELPQQPQGDGTTVLHSPHNAPAWAKQP